MSSTMMDEGGWRATKHYVHNSARDSLSPRGFYSSGRDEGDKCDKVVLEDVGVEQLQAEVSGRHAEKQQHHLQSTFCQCPAQQTDMTTTLASTMAKPTCLPRSLLARDHRPFKLELDDSFGATSVTPGELRQLIKKNPGSDAIASSLRLQTVQHTSLLTPFPYKGRKKYLPAGQLIGASILVRAPNALPPNPTASHRSLLSMGNQHSHHAASHGPPHLQVAMSSSSVEDGSSMESIVNPRLRNRAPPKKTSINMLKKRAAPAVNLTHTVIEVPRAATAPNLDLIEDDQYWIDEKDTRRVRHVKTLSMPSPALPSQPGSPATITEESAARPLSASTTITRVSIPSDEHDAVSSPLRLRVSALSPTIPTPSPLPEDSPHQYGLKDFADFANTPSPRPDQNKAKRRSSGLDIFNEAKSLQSAASFLNGLSNARRRAESRARSTRSTTKTRLTSASTTNLPYSNGSSNLLSTPAYRSHSHLPLDEPPSPCSTASRPLTPKLDDLSRTLGHTHKSSGFAYAKPLSFLQLKCYRNHDCLLRSGNKLYQVECAVCHKDESGDYYWSCSWCALRMCEECRAWLRKTGMKALKEKIRTAEFGAQP